MSYSADAIEETISDVAAKHILPHGADYTTMMSSAGVLLTVTHKNWTQSVFIRLRGMPANIQHELATCSTHCMAMRLIQHIYHP